MRCAAPVLSVLALVASLAAPLSAQAGKANLLVNGDFSADTTGWSGAQLSDGRPLLNLFVDANGELNFQGRYDRCDPGDLPSCKQLPPSPLLSQTVSLTAGTYKLSWYQHNDGQQIGPINAFDVRVLEPGEPLYVQDPNTGYYVRTPPDMQGEILVIDPVTNRWVTAPPATHTLKFKAPVDGVYTIYLGLHGVGRLIGNGLAWDTVWIDQVRLSKVCKKNQPAC